MLLHKIKICRSGLWKAEKNRQRDCRPDDALGVKRCQVLFH